MKSIGLILCFVLTLTKFALPAQALDLSEAERSGVLVREALALGKNGDWEAAQSRVSGADLLIRDIVLWRKLRASAGTVAEYNAYIARRPDWPGQTQLKAIYASGEIPFEREPMSDFARENLNSFNDLYAKRDYASAASFLTGITTDLAPLGQPARWADRRRRLARREARLGNARSAYTLAAYHFLGADEGYAYADLEWIAGWVSLTMLKEPGRAAGHFERFAAAVQTPISLGRAGYWAGRAYEALGDEVEAERWFRAGANYQTSFYGQLAAAKINAAPDQRLASGAVTGWQTHPLSEDEELRLVAVLHHAGQERLAFAVMSSKAKRLEDASAFEALGALALELDRPHYAVRIGKAAALKGIVLPGIYYPMHALAGYADRVEPAFAMSIARQETELNPEAISPAGARGLMQLMPGTAKKVATWIDEPYSRSRLTQDWQYNARLGQTYLARRTGQFSGSYVLAAAAYNAGAHRVDQWIEAYGNPLGPGGTVEGMIDWMEKIPFRETRNYVQRVAEGLYVYRARLSGTAQPMTIVSDLSRGMR
ncbi:MAG: lytic transglycosylase domain-containing protein [Pseudomonadota bacterium]